MSSFSSNAILAKARSMYSHRLTEQNYEELLKRRSINDLVAYLNSLKEKKQWAGPVWTGSKRKFVRGRASPWPGP